MSLSRTSWLAIICALLLVSSVSSQAQGPQSDLQEKQPGRPLAERLQIPPEIPGANVPPLQLPPAEPKYRKERDEAINRLYPPLPPLGQSVVPEPGPDGRPLGLERLQHLANLNSPVIKQASAQVAAAQGTAVQAGLYPNPSAGYQADQAGTADTAGLQGGFLEQTIVTAGKLTRARASASIDVANAELALRRTQIDVFTQVRSAYFATLVAQENAKLSQAMARLTEEVFRIQVDRVRSEVAAPYEPSQLRVLALQARADLVRARNRYLAAWKHLTAALGLPGMPPTELTNQLDGIVPRYQYDEALARILAMHTEVLTAQNDVVQARIDLRRAQLTPVPDVTVRGVLQRDHTTPPNPLVVSLQVGVPVPVWDRNQGNIQKSEAQLFRAEQQTQRAQNDLTARLAEAFARYETNRTLVDYYRNGILPDQVQTYRSIYQRHQQDPARTDFNDIVVAQQTLASTISLYIVALGDFWAAAVDVAALLQTDDLFQFARPESVFPVPDLTNLMCPPNGPVCPAPLPPPGLLRPDPVWPSAVPGTETLPMPAGIEKPRESAAFPPSAQGP